MTTSRNRAYVYLQLPDSLETVTAGYYEQESRSGVDFGIFVYSPRYLDHRDAVALEPFELPMRPGRAETVKLRGIFGCLRDASPDSWGRRIIERHLGRLDLSEVDYLLHSPEDRAGALSFGRGKVPPPPATTFNRVVHLQTLIKFADAMARDDPREKDNFPPAAQMAELVNPGTSIGGARPKNVVEDDEGLWIAKFPDHSDRWNNARVEASMLKLAGECGLRASDAKVVTVGHRDVVLVRRFDREKIPGGYLRHRFVSALTVLDAGDTFADRNKWSYLLLADELRRRSHRTPADLLELFQRMVFNALISNTDDHPRNHGLIAPGTNWELAPAYDLTPNPLTSLERRDLAMTAGRYNRNANRENLLSECVRFLLSCQDAGVIIDKIQAVVSTRWHPLMRATGVSESDCERLAPAFNYPGFELPASRP
jgi:serine/threonine-protein kinase HipA